MNTTTPMTVGELRSALERHDDDCPVHAGHALVKLRIVGVHPHVDRSSRVTLEIYDPAGDGEDD
jgi:hypothetical protein